jgi:hypothetical protein
MRALRSSIVCLPLTWYLLGCAGSGWTTQEVTPQDTKQVVHAGEARVETTGGETYRLRGVWVSQDSLGGWLIEPAGQKVAMPLSAVAHVEGRGAGSRWSGALAGMGIGAAIGAIGPIIHIATCEDSEPFTGAIRCEGVGVFALFVTVPAGMLLGALVGAAAQ